MIGHGPFWKYFVQIKQRKCHTTFLCTNLQVHIPTLWEGDIGNIFFLYFYFFNKSVLLAFGQFLVSLKFPDPFTLLLFSMSPETLLGAVRGLSRHLQLTFQLHKLNWVLGELQFQLDRKRGLHCPVLLKNSWISRGGVWNDLFSVSPWLPSTTNHRWTDSYSAPLH